METPGGKLCNFVTADVLPAALCHLAGQVIFLHFWKDGTSFHKHSWESIEEMVPY